MSKMLPKIYRNKKDFFTKKRTVIFKYRKSRNLKFPILADRIFSGFIEYLIKKGYTSQKYEIKNNIAYVKIPKKFCFYSNPVETLETLKLLVGMYQNREIQVINIDHTDCEELDLSASLLMDAILYEIDSHRKLIKEPIRFTGRFKHAENNIANESMLGLLICSGVLKHLGVLKDIVLPKNIKTLDLYDQYIKHHKNINHDDAGQVVAEYFNSCYESCDFQISQNGINKLTNLVSEIVLNCDNHSSYPKRWFCQGHFHMIPNQYSEGRVGVCQLSIISIGNTFYESVCENGTEFIKNKLAEQYNKVSANWKNIFGFIENEKKRELFYSLYCLQENISRFTQDNRDIDRGKGTATLFTNFQDLGKTSNGEKPILSITSGHSNIVFDGTYMMEGDEHSPKIIAFNESNDISEEPDAKYVRIIESFFPGVVINLKFYIDEKYINNLIANKKDDTNEK